MSSRRIKEPGESAGDSRPSLPLDRSVGYQIRLTHRLIQRALQARIERHGVTLGMWYYLRVLWDDDGLTQRELSRRIGIMEPTTLSAIAAMEQEGLVRRERNAVDRRKINIFLTEKGRDLERLLLPAGIDVMGIATRALSTREIDTLLGMLHSMQHELQDDLNRFDAMMDA